MNKTVLVVAFVACLAALSAVSRADMNLLTNGSFELGSYPDDGSSFTTVGPGKNNATIIQGWEVTSGSVDWINGYWPASNGSKSIDMNGYYQNGTLSLRQTVGLTSGQKYHLSFDMAANTGGDPQLKTLEVQVAPTNDPGGLKTMTYSFDMGIAGWAHKCLDFVAGGNEPISITFISHSQLNDGSDSAFGPALDNVSLVAVPVPAAIVLGVMGLGLVGWARKRLV